MALVSCAECGQKISTDTKRCPACGAKRRMPYAARLLVGALGAIIIVAALSNRNAAPPVTPTAAAPSPPHASAYANLSPTEVIQQAEALDRRWAKSNQPYDGKEWILIKKQDVEDARIALRAIPDRDPAKPRAKTLLASFDKREAEGNAYTDRVARNGYAREIERRMLSNGMSATVTAEGKDARVLRIKFVLASKAFAYQVANQTHLVDDAFKLGFQRVTFDDGYGKQYYYTPDKP
jgi:hypothetical protein